MRTRKLSTLYRVVLKAFNQGIGGRYLCNVIDACESRALITTDEYKVLTEHFKTQRPSHDLHIEFFNHRDTLSRFCSA
jgi:hypothetical protein